MGFVVGLLIGLCVGSFFGFILLALVSADNRSDEE